MAIKEIKREWSPCQLDYVKTFLLHSEADVKNLPKCCVGSKATVSETDNEYFCTESGWKLGSELDSGTGSGSTGGGSAGGGIMYVNVTSIGELTTEIDGKMRADLTLDKSYGEVQAAFDAGNYILCKVDRFMETPMMIIPLTSVLHDSYMAFAYGANGAFIDVFWEINGTPMIRASVTE